MLGLRNLRVLLVEDDPQLARTVARVLARQGHVSEVANSVSEALSLDVCYDCGVLDIELPDGSGLDLAERLLDGGQLSAVVFFSACSDPEIRRRASALGPFVDKSIGAVGVERAVAEAASRVARQVVGGCEDVGPRPRTRSGSRRKVTDER